MNRREKWYYFESFRWEYHRAGKKRKGSILDKLSAMFDYDRKYAIKLLKREKSVSQARANKRGRKSKYDEPQFKRALTKLWFLTDQMCSKLLKEAIPHWLPYFEAHFGRLTPDVRKKLLMISPASIDRILKPTKAKIGKGKSGTKPGSMLRNQIPISTVCWDETLPGFLEADTVAHCGGSIEGNYINSITMVDIATTWTELRATWNKGAHGVMEQVEDIENSLPFPILGFNPDNGSEFLNYHLLSYFTDKETNKLRVAFTRSRAYKKDDNAHVEQRNWSHARQLLGYQRLDVPDLVPLINDLCKNEFSLLRNHFYPTFKVEQKVMIKTRCRRIYGDPITPYHRVLNSSHVSDDVKQRLKKQHASLDPINLKLELERKLKKIFALLKKFRMKPESFSAA